MWASRKRRLPIRHVRVYAISVGVVSMNEERFDAMSRRFGRAITRRRLLGASSAIVAGMVLGRGAVRAQSSQGGAAQVVEQFYQAIDAYQYADAYELLGSSLQAGQSPEDFEDGYSDTAFEELKTGQTSSAPEGTEVEVELIAWHNDGTIESFQGSYTVGDEDGQQRILLSSIEQVDPPANVPPLCAIADLSFALGPWDAGAGSRMSNVIATNASNAECVMGGSPRLILTASNGHQLVSSSVAGSPPVGIRVAPSQTASAPLSFSNWCEPTDMSGVTLAIDIAGDRSRGTVDFAANGITFPPCLGQGQASAMSIRGWVAGGD